MVDVVDTKNGLIPREELDVKEEAWEDQNFRYVNVVWTHNGEEVRRDCLLCMKQGLAIGGSASL